MLFCFPVTIGGVFTEDGFIYYGNEDDADIPKPEHFEYRIITADTAQKTKEHNDFTVFAEWGYYQGKIYRLDYLRKRMEAKDLRQTFESFCKSCWAKNNSQNGNLKAIYVEDKASGTGLIQEVSNKVKPKITAVQRNVDKFTRAMDCRPHQANHCIALPYGDKHNFEFVQEVCSFAPDDSHKHDDQTDVMMDAIDRCIIRGLTGKKTGVYIPKRKRG
jgi:predicted phage terminase large subunit-like protein